MKKFILLITLVFTFTVSAQDESFDFPPDPYLNANFPPMQFDEPIISEEEIVGEESKHLEEKKHDKTKKEIISEIKTIDSKIYLDFRDADIREVARVLSKISGVSILVSEDVKANVTLNIEGVTWRRALELILKTYNIANIEKDNFIVLISYDKIQQELDQTPLTTKIITLNFVDIEAAKNYLKAILSKRGTLEGDSRTNSLIITDVPDIITKAENIVHNLDIKTPQVLIDVLMVDKKIEDDFNLGIDWKLNDENTDHPPRSIEQSLLTSNATITLAYGKAILDSALLTSTLQAWKEDSKVDIIANPKIITIDNKTAEINISEQVPYTSKSESTDGGSTQSTQFKDIGIILKVKPHITKDEHIIMEIETEQSFLVKFVGSSEDLQPQIDSRKSKTTMMVRDHETVVIGGLKKKDSTTTINKVPILGDIPFIGKIFRKLTIDDTAKELLLFVTPMILKDTDSPTKSKKENTIQKKKDFVHEKKLEKDSRKMLSASFEKQSDGTIKETPEKIKIPVDAGVKSTIKKLDILEKINDVKTISEKPPVIPTSDSNIKKPIYKKEILTVEEIIVKPTTNNLKEKNQKIPKKIITDNDSTFQKSINSYKKDTAPVTPTVEKNKDINNLPNFYNLNLLPVKTPNEDN